MKTNKNIYYSITQIILISTSLSCSSTQKQEKPEFNDLKYINEMKGTSTISNAAAKSVNGKSYVEIEFETNNNQLSEYSKNSIKDLISESNLLTKDSEILILSWGDEEYPSKTMKKLPNKQIELATSRNNSIQKYIKSLKNIEIEKYNLAQEPNLFSKWFKSDDTRMKNAMIKAGLPTTADDAHYLSKASHAVLILKDKSSEVNSNQRD